MRSTNPNIRDLTIAIGCLIFLPALIFAQGKTVKPLAENASLAETQKWLVDALAKNASYKTQVNSEAVSNAKFESCRLSYTLVRKTGAKSQDTMGVTTRTHTAKTDVSFDLSFVEAGGIQLADHIFPDFQTITIKFREGGVAASSPALNTDVELVVKYEAGEAIKAALLHAQRLCTSKN